ncbi:membrane transporter [Stereum hirsutum FP-91666 SS1]|uniref:Membrane transporter n=1 Tax=Stereum hirsutum (strain FP-91666) TaxID=721885 RepID=R7RWX1_STEHR|nr:membrane transporter [Stereum hirsutum FP-91666 SS1]EIM79881.1 membrane transporter [Stereum hirsutum FP-91666 SS1]
MSDVEKQDGVEVGTKVDVSDDTSSTTAGRGEVLSLEDVDPALDAKMHLVNNVIDEIGWTPYHVKLFVLTGFGYAVDSLLLLLQSITSTQAVLEFQPSFSKGLTIASYVGLLVGALFWGMTSDIIGRRFAFNTSLLICSIFAIAAGASPNWEVLGLFVALSAFGGGGNLVMDTTVFLEFLPSKQQWLLTLLACWWGVGQLLAGLVAWPFLSDFACESAPTCTKANNMGWRYEWYTCGALVFVMSILRVTVIRLHETPKYLLGKGRDEEVVQGFRSLADKYGRPCSLTVEQLQACGVVNSEKGANAGKKGMRASIKELGAHLGGLFATRKMGLSTSLVWFSWTLIGLAYPLYNVFLPEYLKSRGAETGDGSNYTTWRNYAIVNACGIFGPVLAGFLCNWRVLGRRGTMVIGALVTMTFFFAYTQVRTSAQNLGFNCAISFCLNIYYGCLYAYTPEVLPSAHRATGNGIAVGCNRVMGILSAVVATVANTETVVPIWICAALYVVMAAVALAFPFEPYGKRSS